MKKGVSAIIATVLIIMISVAAVAILWQFIIPNVKENLKQSTSEKVSLSIETDGGYTTWDEIQKIARVQVKRGNDNVTLTGMDFSFVREGSSVKRNRTDVPARNEIKIYEFNLSELTGKPEKVLVAPITARGTGSVVSQTSTVNNYTSANPPCVYSDWSPCNSSGLRNKTKLDSSALGCVGELVVIGSCTYIPKTITISGATDIGFNKIYTYDSDSGQWVNGSYQIYKNTLWYLTNGTVTYTAEDNDRDIPPTEFSPLDNYPSTIIVSGFTSILSSYNGIYTLDENFEGSLRWSGSGENSIFNPEDAWWGDKWFIGKIHVGGGWGADSNVESNTLIPPKNGWTTAGWGTPALEYTLRANATVSY